MRLARGASFERSALHRSDVIAVPKEAVLRLYRDDERAVGTGGGDRRRDREEHFVSATGGRKSIICPATVLKPVRRQLLADIGQHESGAAGGLCSVFMKETRTRRRCENVETFHRRVK